MQEKNDFLQHFFSAYLLWRVFLLYWKGKPVQHITSFPYLRTLIAPYALEQKMNKPKRKTLELLQPNFAFIKPVQQNFVRNPRLMSGTRCMVLMLLGWAGQEQAIETTIGIIAKKIGRSVRQVHRYLQDAIEEGYLFYSRTKNRLGYYTGIKIHLNFRALKPKSFKKRRNQDMTEVSDTNSNSLFIRENTEQEQSFLNTIEAIIQRNGLSLEPD